MFFAVITNDNELGQMNATMILSTTNMLTRVALAQIHRNSFVGVISAPRSRGMPVEWAHAVGPMGTFVRVSPQLRT